MTGLNRNYEFTQTWYETHNCSSYKEYTEVVKKGKRILKNKKERADRAEAKEKTVLIFLQKTTLLLSMNMAWRLRTTISHQHAHIHLLALLLPAGTPLLYPEMLFFWKAESQGERHLHDTDNQRTTEKTFHTLQKIFLSPSLILCTYL